VPYALVARLLQAALAADARAVATEAPDTVQRTLQHLLPACGPPPALPLQTHSVAPTVLWALARFGAECACTVLIDDLQFADPASLEQLPALLDAVATPTTPPLVWALALRSAEVPPVMQAWLAGAVGDSAQTLQLGPLDAAGVQTLLDTLGLPGPDARLWAGTLHRHTGGHPLYLLQTLMALSRQGGLSGARALATLGSAVPAAGGTLALVQARITRLGAQAQDLLNVAALAGQDFNLALATRVLDTSPLALADSWHALEQAHLMTGERIAHDLVGEAALRSVPTAAAAAWHALIAAHLAGSGGSLPRIAAHWRAAGRWPEAGRAFADAAAQIRLQLRQAEEAALLPQAADCQAAAGNADAEGVALFLLFKAQWARKHRAGIAEATNRLQALPATPRTGPWAQATRGITAFDDRPNDESLALMVGAQAPALAVGDTALALWLKGWEVGYLSLLNRPHQVLEAVQRTLPLIDEMPSHAAACSALSQCGIALEVGGHVQQGLALLETAEARYRELGELMLTADSQTHQSVCHFHLGRVDEAARLLEAGCQAMADLNGGTAEPHTSDYCLARYWREQGRLGPALQHMLDLLDLLARLDADGNATLRALFGVEAGLAYVLLGQPHRARAHVEAPRGVAAASGRVDGLPLEAVMARAMGQPITPLLLRALPLLPDCWRPERWRWRAQSWNCRARWNLPRPSACSTPTSVRPVSRELPRRCHPPG